VGLIRYSDFCNNLNFVFTDAANPNAVVEESKSTALMNEVECAQLATYMSALNNEIVSKRILLKPGFHDFDRSKSQHVTSHQFLRVLKTLTLMPPSADIFGLITRRYCDLDNTQEINYWRFCSDVDRPEAIYPPYVSKRPVKEWVYDHGVHRTQTSTFFNDQTQQLDVINNRFMQAKIDISNDPADVEDRIRSIVVMKRIRIEEFFIDFDKLRKGRVTRNQFKSILSGMNFSLTDDEMEGLADKYKTNDPEVFFNYIDFCASINKAFTIYGIEKDPNARVPPLSHDDTFLARRKYLGGHTADVECLLDSYREAIKT
jgi:Ca2+-binding EF-hand superfamily protein